MRTSHGILWLGTALVLAGVASAGTVLFQDGFSEYPPASAGAPLWRVESGTWAVTPDGFLGKDCEGHFTADGAHTGLREWTDYTLRLELKLVSRGDDWRDGPWIGFRYADSRNAYTLGFYNRMTALHKASAGKETGDGRELATAPFALRDNAWHRLAVQVQGPRISVRLDDRPLLDVTDQDWNGTPAVLAGGIVLAARQAHAGAGSTQVLFRNVHVEAIGEVPPGLIYTAARARQEGKPRMSMIEFIKARPPRPTARPPRKVLAFYYTWYGTPARHGRWVHWETVRPEQHDIASSTHYPAKGAYDSHDPAVVEDHIRLAKAAGLDAFITTWWGQGSFDDQAFPLVLDAAARLGFEATVYWETAPGKGQAQVDQAIRDLAYVVSTYGRHPGFLKHDGRPVIFVYGRVMGQVPASRWPDIVTGARTAAGREFLLIADGYSDAHARLFDGIHTYNIAGQVSRKTPDEVRQMAAKSFPEAVAMARRRGALSCLTIIPGYDDTKIRKPGLKAERHDGATYQVLWEEAIKADPDWVLITSWNEWHEGSEIEPSWEDGDRYLRLTAEYAPRFKSTPLAPAAVPAGDPGASPGRAKALQDLFRGVTVGILPDSVGEAAFWLAESGVACHELTWDEVVAPAGLSVARFPLLLYAGGEQYVQNWQRPDDVDEGLTRYLRGGGMLVCLPSMPFPFYYNEKGEPVVNAARFGIPISGSGAYGREDTPTGSRTRGWETPPAGPLRFQIDREAFASLAPAVPFPTVGDRRWRPAVRLGLATEDVYFPLARLVDDQGNEYGDGIAYIEHRASDPVHGKALYAWMRMPDVLGREDLFFEVFRFAATRMTRPPAPH